MCARKRKNDFPSEYLSLRFADSRSVCLLGVCLNFGYFFMCIRNIYTQDNRRSNTYVYEFIHDGKIMKVRKKCPCNSFAVFIVCSVRIFFFHLPAFALLGWSEEAYCELRSTLYASHYNHNYIPYKYVCMKMQKKQKKNWVQWRHWNSCFIVTRWNAVYCRHTHRHNQRSFVLRVTCC